MKNWQKQVLKMTENEPYNLINNLEKMKDTPADYTKLDELMTRLGFTPYNDERGFYFHSAIGLNLIDLTDVAQDEPSVMKEILRQTITIGRGQGQEMIQQTVREALGL
jgi:hypothetical protein